MKTGLVVGAASGIGRGLADVLHEMEVMVIRADIAFPKNAQNINFEYVDASDEASVIALTQHLHGKSIVIDYLIITIGAIDEGSVLSYPVKNLSWMLEANILAQYRLVKHLTPFLQKSISPKILLTGSSAGLGALDAETNLMPYIISKHALMGLFKTVHGELSKKNIQISLLLPHRIKGNLSKNSADLRKVVLNEEVDYLKGAQRTDVDLDDSYDFAKFSIKRFLEGKTYISNNPLMIVGTLEAELSEIKKDLLIE